MGAAHCLNGDADDGILHDFVCNVLTEKKI
jgi:hypothetical protein